MLQNNMPPKNEKPFIQRAVLWQSVISLALYPFALLMAQLSSRFHPAFGIAGIVVYLAGMMVTIFWSLSNLINGFVNKDFSYRNAVPAIFTGISAYILYAVAYGLPPFGIPAA